MQSLAVKNLKGKPVRTAVLVTLTALLALGVFAGTVIITSLRSGLGSLEDRLGAEIMVVPYEATTKKSFENIILQGSTGYFYMEDSLLERVKEREGIGQLSVQLYLASTSSGCCSIPVQIIGFDPETDFTVQPWIKKSSTEPLGKLDIVVGSDLNAFVGDTLRFYGVDCRVAAKLDKTGTSFDTTVFTNMETIKEMTRASLERGLNSFKDIDPDKAVSCIMINTAEGYSPDEVLNDINLHVKKVKAVRTKEMISGVSDSLGGVSNVVGVLIGAVWVLGTVILLLAFAMSVNERKKEFAVLRVAGASRGKLARTVMSEALAVGVTGSIIGIALGLIVMLPFAGAVEDALAMPYLLPPAASIIGIACAAAAAAIAAGMLAAAVSALRISRIDTGVILRGDN